MKRCRWGDALAEIGNFFFQAEDGIRDLVRSRGLGDVYKRQVYSVGGAGVVTLTPGDVVKLAVENENGASTITILSLIHI